MLARVGYIYTHSVGNSEKGYDMSGLNRVLIYEETMACE